MKHLVNINVGIDSIAKTYLKVKENRDHEPIVYGSTGTLNSIKLHRYKLKDGTEAEEYLQIVIPNSNGQNIYFLALKTEKRNFEWPSEKIRKKLLKNF